MRQTLSACMVIYHEEKVLERCLQSLQGVVDEIVLVHDGECGDRSLEIAEKYGCRIFVEPHAGCSEAHRVLTLEKSTCDWVMWIDADEFLPPGTAEAIPKLVQDDKADAIYMVWPIWDGEREISQGWPMRGLLFRKSRLFYLGFPHMHFDTKGVKVKTTHVIKHQPSYNNYTLHTFRTKWRKWALIEADILLTKSFDKTPQYNYPYPSWPKQILLMKRLPWLFIPYGVALMLVDLIGGSWRHGLLGWRQSFLWGAYKSMVFYYVLTKRGQRHSRKH